MASSTIPFAEQSELACISGCLRDDHWLQESLANLSPDEFFGSLTRPIFQAIAELEDTSNLPAIADKAAEIGSTAPSDSYRDLMFGCLSNRFYEVAKPAETILKLKDVAAKRRALDYLHNQSSEDVLSSSNLSDAIQVVISKLEEIVPSLFADQSSTADEIFPEIFLDLEERIGGVIPPSTGFDGLDDINALGGWEGGRLIIPAGRPSMGKTRFARAVAVSAVKQGMPVKFYSLEESRTQLLKSMAATEAGINPLSLKRPTLEDLKALLPVVEFDYWNLLTIASQTTGSKVLSDIPRYARANPGCLIIIDHLALMLDEHSKDAANNMAALGRITKLLAAYTKLFKIDIVLLAQLNRGVEGRNDKRPMLSDLRESGHVEQNADIVMMLYREEYYNPDTVDRGITEIIIRKNRYGEQNLVVKVLTDNHLQTLKNLPKNSYVDDY
jgi:replicative DNA helicase